MDRISEIVKELTDLIYLHRLFGGITAIRGNNEQTRTIERLMEERLREIAAFHSNQ